MTTTPDPTEYLLARYAEDEKVARAASRGPWRYEAGDDYDDGCVLMVTHRTPDELQWEEDWPSTYVAQTSYDTLSGSCHNSDNDGAHIARHDPARVLAGIAAKRDVVRQHCRSGDYCDLCCSEVLDDHYPYPCPTLYALLQEFADREDFPDEWRTT